MKRPLILVCGGGHCKSVIEAAESAGFAIKGILDVAERIGDDVLGYKIVGTDDDAALYAAECDFVVTVYQERRGQKPYNRQADRRRMPVCNGGGFDRPRVAPRHARRGDGGAPSCHGQCRSVGWTTLHHQHRRQRGARCDGVRRRARVDRSDAQRRVACWRRGVCGQRRGACSMCRRWRRMRDRCRQRGDKKFDRTGNLCRQSGTTNQ